MCISIENVPVSSFSGRHRVEMTMCISILLALVVFLLLVSKILPPTSITIPLIAKYLLFTFIMNIVTILITVIIINWNFKTPRTHRMPRWVRAVFLNWLPRVLLMMTLLLIPNWMFLVSSTQMPQTLRLGQSLVSYTRG